MIVTVIQKYKILKQHLSLAWRYPESLISYQTQCTVADLENVFLMEFMYFAFTRTLGYSTSGIRSRSMENAVVAYGPC